MTAFKIAGLALALSLIMIGGAMSNAMAKSASEYQDEAGLYLSKSNYGAAIKNYRKALKEDPKSEMSRIGLISALQGDEKWQEALKEAQELISVHPNFTAAYYNLGEIQEHLGNMDAAKSAYKTYIQRTGTSNLPPSPELRIKFRRLGLL